MQKNDPAGLAHAKKLIEENQRTKDTFLDLGNCGLVDLSELPQLWELGHLEGLNMGPVNFENGNWIKSSNSFSSNTIGENDAIAIANSFKKLTYLNLSHNKITGNGAKAIAYSLSSLKSLHLSYNQIDSDSIKVIANNLKNLINFSLSGNEVRKNGITAIAKKLKNLIYLDLSNCNLSENDVIEIANNLNKLKHLYLYDCNVGENGATSIANNLQNLQSLGLFDNYIGDNGAIEIANKLIKLTTLDLYSNEIGDDGAIAIADNLANLTTLDLSYNNIEDKAAKQLVNKLYNLQSINLNNNSINKIPEEILANISALREYFQSKLIPNNTTKMILVGNSTAGKTTLAKYLMTGKFTKDHDSTHGIKHWAWTLDIKGKSYKVNIRDFGGQDYFHATHNLFLDYESLFILVHNNENVHNADCKEDDQYHEVSYWLGNISDIVSVDNIAHNEDKKNYNVWYLQNKTDHEDHKQEWLKPHDHSSDAIVEKQFFISIKAAAENNANKPLEWRYFEESLKEKIVALSQTEIVDWWAVIRDDALPEWRKESLYLTRSEFSKKCLDFLSDAKIIYHIADNSFSNVLTYLKNAGEVVYFNDRPELQDYIFTGADKLTNYLFKEILNKEAKENNGIIKNLKKNEDAQLYINVLLAYGLIFEDPTNKGVYIAPQFLPVEPHIAKFIHLMPLGYAIKFMTYMPRYLITRLITYFAQKYEDAHYWRYGVMYKKSGLICLIRVDVNAQIIYVHIEDKKEKYDALFEIYLMIMGKGTLNDLLNKVRDVSGQESFNIALAETQKMEKREKQMEFSLNGIDFAPFTQWKNAIESKAQYVLSNDNKYLPLNATVYKIIDGYTSAPKRIFLSYAHADGIHLENFKNHLSSLERSGKIATWYDGKLLAGQSWDDTIRKELRESDIVLTLLSSNFMASQYIWEIELPEATKAGATIVPIFLSPVYYEDNIVFLSKKQGLPKEEKWILGSAWRNTDEAWLEVVKGIVGVIDK